VSSPGGPDACLNECINPDAPSVCNAHVFDGNLTVSSSSTIGCYCSSRLDEQINSQGLISGTIAVSKSEGTLCSRVAQDFLTYNAFALVASVIVVLVNATLRLILIGTGTFEGHGSLSKREQAVAFKTFLALFLNTACIVLIINAALPSTVGNLSIGGYAVFVGEYSGFDITWHTSVGAGLVFTMVSPCFRNSEPSS
jgi:hypothetical protein